MIKSGSNLELAGREERQHEGFLSRVVIQVFRLLCREPFRRRKSGAGIVRIGEGSKSRRRLGNERRAIREIVASWTRFTAMTR